MKIEIVTKNINNSDMVREFIQRKVQFALERIESSVKHVTVRLEDEASKSDVFAGHCQIDVTLNPSRHVHVSANGDSAFDSISQATRKIEHAIKHDIDRHRRSARIRHQQTKQEFYSTLSDEHQITEETVDDV